MYLITHSLLSSWNYAIKDNPFGGDRDYMAEFMSTLKREPMAPTPAMQNGIDFEHLVTDIAFGDGDRKSKWYGAASRIADIVRGGQFQIVAKKPVSIDGFPLLLYGRLDVLKAGNIYDIKYSAKSYDRGKYISNTQHPVYLELVPEAESFTYLVSNGSDVWSETYRRDETPDIQTTIQQFLSWLTAQDLMDLYKEHWATR